MTDLSQLRRSLWRGAPWLALILVASAVLVEWSFRDAPVPTQRWIAVVVEPLEHRIGLIGRIVPGESMTMTAPFEGHIGEKFVTDDQRVARGQVLLRISPDLLHMQIRQALAERLKAQGAVQVFEDWANGEEMTRARRALTSSQQSFEDTQRKLVETQGLLKQGIVPRMEVDTLTRLLESQRADVSAAQAGLRKVLKRGQGEHRQIADMQLANTIVRHEALLALEQRGAIKAPFPGIIVPLQTGPAGQEKPLEAGVRLTQGQPIFALANTERMSVQAKVDEADINQLREGMPVEISGDGFKEVLQGTVTTVGAQAIASDMRGDGASYYVTVMLPALELASQQRLRLGMSARLSILTYQNPKAIVLPADVIGGDEGAHFVIHRTAVHGPESRREVSLGRATAVGVEIFGIDTGFVLRGVTMD